jgi:hypothetical protein
MRILVGDVINRTHEAEELIENLKAFGIRPDLLVHIDNQESDGEDEEEDNSENEEVVSDVSKTESDESGEENSESEEKEVWEDEEKLLASGKYVTPSTSQSEYETTTKRTPRARTKTADTKYSRIRKRLDQLPWINLTPSRTNRVNLRPRFNKK